MHPAVGPLPEGGDWVVEFAWEGLRCIGHVRPDGLRLRTANGRDVTSAFPELAEPLTRRAPRGGMVLDGTVVALGEAGLPRRRQLQRRTATMRPSPALVRRTPVGLVVGDLLWLAGHDTITLPYRRRRELLDDLGLARAPVVVSPSFPLAEAEAVMRTAEEYRAEALHAKHLDAPYRPGRRSRAWLRVPLRRSGLVVVGGWNPADPRRPDSVGALLLGVPGEAIGAAPGLHYVGRVGVGAGEEQRALAALLARWRSADSPFVTPPPASVAGDAHWAAPRLVGRVEFADWTADGRLRLPVWRGLRGGGEPEPAEADPTAPGARWIRPRSEAASEATTAPVAPQRRQPATGTAAPDAPVPAGPVSPATDPAAPADPASVPAASDPAASDPAASAPAAASHPASVQAVPVPPAPVRTRPEPAAVEARRLEQHFVYNALNTIAALMRTDPVHARELLLGFADLTRVADRPEGATGTLGDEIAAVRAYLQLEQARFGRRLQVEIVVDEGLHALPMGPRRVLDAVRAVVQQRIEPRPGGGTVTVTAERAGAGCLVRVDERDGEGRSGEPTLIAPT
jgi:bifunctional non-homologous end joining protein LigD